MPDRLTARPQSAPPAVELPWIVQADGGLRSGQRPHEPRVYRCPTLDGKRVAKRKSYLSSSATICLA